VGAWVACFLFGLAWFLPSGFAATVSWVGPATGSHLWSSPSNWPQGRLPGPSDDVRIEGEGLSLVVQVTGVFNLRSLDSACTIRVVSDIGANSQLIVSQALTNRGAIRLESQRSDRTSTLAVTGPLGIENRGLIVARAENGGERRIGGGIVNRGTIQVEPGMDLVVNNRERLFVQADGRIQADGRLLIEEGRVAVLGGRTSGEVRIYNGVTRVAAGATAPVLLKLIGAASALIGNELEGSTLRLDTEVGHFTTLASRTGAVNVGRIVMGSSRSDRASRLDVTAGFTNAPTGVIEVVSDAGGDRGIQGQWVNQGQLISTQTVVQVTGTYQADGGRADGDARFINVRIAPTQATARPSELQLFGDANVLVGNNLTNLSLRVISDVGANAALTIPSNAVNRGEILLESLRSDRTTTLNAAGVLVENRGRIRAVSSQGGLRRLRGSFNNLGRIEVDPGTPLTLENRDSVLSLNAGVVDVSGSWVVDSGRVNVAGGQIAGDLRLFHTVTWVAPTFTANAVVRILGTTSTLIGNESSTMTLRLDTDVGNQTTLTTLPGAINMGRIVMGSGRSDRVSRLDVTAGFTNAPTGTVEMIRDAEGQRQIHGLLVNQGTVQATAYPVTFTGTYVVDGGTVDGEVLFADARVAPLRSPAVPDELMLFGGGSVLVRDNLPNLTLRVISDVSAHAELQFNTNLINRGVIRLESRRSDRTASLRGLDGTLVNGATGLIEAVAGSGGTRVLSGKVRNLGTIRLAYPLSFAGAGAQHENQGILELGGHTLTVAGVSFVNGLDGRIRGAGGLDVAGVAFSNAGLISPGSSPGRIQITGNFTQTATGEIDVELSGTGGAGVGHDVIEVASGAVNLQGGTLSTRVLGSFVPEADTRFRVLTASGGISGRFARTPNLQILPNRYLQAEYLPTALELRTLAGQNPALPPSITLHPSNQEVAENERVQFAVSVNGAGPFTYQWRRNGQNIPGATSETLTLNRVLAADFGRYDVVVSNASGSTTSNAAELSRKTTPTASDDYGDAPDPNYPTTLAHGGASQRVRAGFSLGGSIDADNGSLQDPLSTADGADEDGVQFLGALIPGQVVVIRVLHSRQPGDNPGRLSAWIDWAANGTWAEAGDRIINDRPLLQRTNDFNITVPGNAVLGFTFARFRLYEDQAQGPSGASQEAGEVEDYRVEIIPPGGSGGGGGGTQGTMDFGDAPAGYRTLLVDDGARHIRDPELYLGQSVDVETNGIPSNLGFGDDANGTPDDEDGVTGPPVVFAGGSGTYTVTVFGSGKVDAWFDFNRDGDFGDAGERVLTGEPFSFQSKSFVWNIPAQAVAGLSYARFRVSRQGVNTWFGQASDGEVEDYAFLIAATKKDWGDAPARYPTLNADGGASHTIADGFHLGKSIDGEDDGQPTGNATGDDVVPKGDADDEDGVFFATPLVPGQEAEVEVEASASGRLDAWIDFGGNDDWTQATDRIFTAYALPAGRSTLRFTVPANAAVGPTFARFRLSRNGLNTFTGDGGEGEVEDYRVVIEEDSGCELNCSGTDFWVAFPGNYAPDPANPVVPRLRFTGSNGTGLTISIPGLSSNIVATIAGGGATVVLPAAVDLGALNDGVLNRGIHVTATAPVSLFVLSRVEYTSDGYLALPTEALTGEYVVAAYPNTQVGVPEISGTQFTVVATRPNTTLLITPSYETGLRMAGVPYSVVLTNAGDCYQLRNTNDAPADLTGTIVEADQPVAAFGGNLCGNVNSSSLFYCDYLVEQLLPTERLGAEFFVAPLATRSGGETVRMVAVRNNTQVEINGSPITLTNRGDVYQVLLSQAARIESSKPILLSQFASSSDFDGVDVADPFMVQVPARTHFSATHTFATGGTNFTSHHVTVVAPASVTTLTLDGAVTTPSFLPIGSSSYRYAHLNVSQGIHSLSASAEIGVIVYGWGLYESYGWSSCLFLGDTTSPRLTCLTNAVTVVLGSDSTDVPCKVRVPDLRSQVTFTDNCSISRNAVVTQLPPPGMLIGVGTHDVVLSVADDEGNIGRCVIPLTVTDPAPGNGVSLTCPEDRTVRCEDPTGAVVNYIVEALKGCTPIAVTCTPASGTRFPVGTTEVICRISEPGEAVQECRFKVTVNCSKKREVRIQPPFRPTPTPDNPNPALEIVVEWDDETGAVLEAANGMEGPWVPVQTARGRHVIQVLKERGKFFRVKTER